MLSHARSILNMKTVPMFTGIALGSALAYYSFMSRGVLRAESPGAINPTGWTSLKVSSTKKISHDTKELVFDLPKGHSLGGQTAYCVVVKFDGPNGKPVIRPYTPVSPPRETGSATFVVKAYPGGKMSEHIHSLKVGDSLDFKGPIQKILVKPNQHKHIALLGGGSGITPMFQILEEIANNPKDKTKVDLFYASRTPADILLKKEIDELVAKKPGQLSVTYFVDKADSAWKGRVGFITPDFLSKNMFKPTDDNVKVFVCGPPTFYDVFSGRRKSPSDEGELSGALKDMGFRKDQVFKF